jgi:hypothetical protein
VKTRRSAQGLLVGVAIAVPGGALAVPALASPTASRQSAVFTFTATTPGAPSGTRLEVRWRDPEKPDEKPPAVRTMITRFHPGTVIDTAAVAQCTASDAEMLLRGAPACPQDSVLGPGGFIADNGDTSLVPRYATFATTMINNRDELITLSEMIDPAFQPQFRMVNRQAARDGAYVTEFPVIPMSGDPADPYTGLASMWARGEPRGRDGRTYLRTPPTCPPGGYWTNTMTFVYRDGVEQSVQTQSRCRDAGGTARRGRRRARRGRERAGQHPAVSTSRDLKQDRQRH